jgi:hypothetical protein
MPQIETTLSASSRGIDTNSSGARDSDETEVDDSIFDIESKVFLYRDSYLHHAANILGTLIASLICIAAIVVLYLVPDMKKRLVIVGIFTGIFSIALSLVTSARRVEIFAATAA